jgi:hypothetical protein
MHAGFRAGRQVNYAVKINLKKLVYCRRKKIHEVLAKNYAVYKDRKSGNCIPVRKSESIV